MEMFMYSVEGHQIKHRRISLSWLPAAAVLAAGYTGWALLRDLPPLEPETASRRISVITQPGKLAWPGSQSAVGLLGNDILDTNGEQKPVPTASTAKIITALVILDKKPLQLNQPGPYIPITESDVQRYKDYVARDGSVLPVRDDSQLSQYQMLQAILIPSSNNIADTLAIWAYGSLPAYKEAANDYLARHGLRHTKVGSDASGLAPDSVSTASDMVKLGKLAMQNPVIAQIAGQSKAGGFPLVNEIKNVNSLLGLDGIVGLKTGNSDQAGGTFVGAATVIVNKQPQMIITAVMASPNRQVAMSESHALIKSSQINFAPAQIVKKDQTAGFYRQPWGGRLEAVMAGGMSVEAWRGSTQRATLQLDPIDTGARTGQTVGRVTLGKKTVPVKLKDAPANPSAWWRLTHPMP